MNHRTIEATARCAASSRPKPDCFETAPPSETTPPIRALHVVSRMNRGGIETWLMNVLRHIDRDAIKFDFLVNDAKPGDYDSEIRALGGEILHCQPLQRIWTYRNSLNSLLASLPRYDILHSHLDGFSGFPIKCAAQAGIPTRIAHCHNDLGRARRFNSLIGRPFAIRSRCLIHKFATHGLAPSQVAARSLFGIRWSNDPRWQVLYYGIDLRPFQSQPKVHQLRREFGIEDHVPVIGHVGRFNHQKNHALVLRVAEVLRNKQHPFHIVLVGDGPLRRTFERECESRNLGGLITFAGIRTDVPQLFTSLFDALLFPSHFEGLPLVLVEAQAAGCPVVISDVITHEVDAVPHLITRLSLNQPPEHWAGAVLQAIETRQPRSDAASIHAALSEKFSITSSIRLLTSLYADATARSPR